MKAVSKSAPQGFMAKERKLIKPLVWMSGASLLLLAITAGMGNLSSAPKKSPPRQIVINEAEKLATSDIDFKRLDEKPEGFPPEYLFVVGYEIIAVGDFSHPFKVQFLDDDVKQPIDTPIILKLSDKWAELPLTDDPPEGVSAAVESQQAGLFVLCEKREGPPPASGEIELTDVETGKPASGLFLKASDTHAKVGEVVTFTIVGEIDDNLRQLWFVGDLTSDPLEHAIGSEFRFHAQEAGNHKITFLSRDPNGKVYLKAEAILTVE